MPNNRVNTSEKKTPKSRGPWVDWIESDEGKKCADFESLKAAKYLENRLWYAFMAGAPKPKDRRICDE